MSQMHFLKVHTNVRHVEVDFLLTCSGTRLTWVCRGESDVQGGGAHLHVTLLPHQHPLARARVHHPKLAHPGDRVLLTKHSCWPQQSKHAFIISKMNRQGPSHCWIAAAAMNMSANTPTFIQCYCKTTNWLSSSTPTATPGSSSKAMHVIGIKSCTD